MRRACQVAVAACILLGAAVAQEAPSTVDASADLTRSLRFETNRDLQAALDGAAAHLQRGDTSRAIPDLQQVLDQSHGDIVLIDGVHRSAAAAANRLLSSLPPADLQLYERHSGNAAAAALASARSSANLRALRSIAVRYRHTDAGAQALRDLAFWSLDTAQFADADAAFCELIEQSPAPAAAVKRRPADLVAWCVARLHRGDRPGADQLRRRFQEQLAADAQQQLAELIGPTAQTEVVQSDAPTDWLPASTAARWTTDLVSDESRRLLIGDVLRQLDENSVHPLTQVTPLAVPDGFVIRTLDGVVCVDVATGHERWRHSFPGEAHAPSEEQQSINSTRAFETSLHRLLADSVAASLTTDGERVYRIRPATTEGAAYADPLSAFDSGNDLIALSVASGDAVWTVPGRADRGSSDSHAETDPASPLLFRSAPTPFGSQLLIVAEQSGEVSLEIRDAATGERIDRIPLCVIDDSLGTDPYRAEQSAPVSVFDGIAVCPTGGGAVAAVDLLTRQVVWGFRYARERSLSGALNASSPSAPSRDSTTVLSASGWRDTQAAAADGRIALAGRESNELYVFDLRSGDLLWSASRGDGLYLAGIEQDALLIVESHAVAAFNPLDGSPLWIVPLPRAVAGRGFAFGRYCVVPLVGGGLAAVDIDDGRIMELRPAAVPTSAVSKIDDLSAQAIAPINLVRHGDRMVAASLTSVSLQTPLGTAIDAAQQRLTGDPTNDHVALDSASLLLEAGEIATAIDLLTAHRPTPQSDAYEAWRGLALEAGIRIISAQPGAEIPQWLDEIAESDAEHIRLRWARLAATDLRNHSLLIEHAFQSFDRNAEQYAIELDGGARRVRLDRAIQSQLIAAREAVAPEDRLGFDLVLSNALQPRLNEQGELARLRFADLLDHLPTGAELLLAAEPRWSSGSEFAQAQLSLLQAAELFPPETAAAALLQLARLYSAHSDAVDAAAIYRRLTTELAEVVLPDGRTVAATLSSIPDASPTERDAGGFDAWPLTRPVITTRSATDGDLYFLPVNLVSSGGGLFDRLNVAVHRNGRPLQEFPQLYEGTVRFSGAGLSRPWAVLLPDSRSDLRSAQVFPELRRGWGFGQFLVLQVGAELFGIAPFNTSGEPSASVVWPRDEGGRGVRTTTSLISAVSLDLTAQSAAVQPAEVALGPVRVDEFGHIVGRVAAVRPGYTAVQQDGSIVAFETANGREFWRRTGLPPGVRCFGDERHVVVLDPGRQRMDLIRALDGALLHTAALPFQTQHLLSVQGLTALVMGGDNPVQLQALSFLDGSILWSRDFPAGSLAFPVDDELHGVLQPDGTVEFLNWIDGSTAGTVEIDVPQPLIHFRCLADADCLNLIVSGARNDPGLEAATPAGGIHSNEGHRRLIINGHWSAIDRESMKHRWQAPIDNSSLLLDQPVDVPLIIMNELRQPPDRIGQGALVGRVRAIDRRTGELIYDEHTAAVHNYFIVERDAEAGWVELRLPDRTVRFDYAAGTPIETPP